MKKISKDQSLMLLGLFALASEHFRKCEEAEKAMARLLGLSRGGDEIGNIQDALYQGRHSADELWEALKKDGFEVDETA